MNRTNPGDNPYSLAHSGAVILSPMRSLFLLFASISACAQSTVSVQEPISVLPPLMLNGTQISCPACGAGGGGGGTGSGLMPWNPPASQPPTLSNWTLINGTGNATTSDVTGGVQIYASGAGGISGLGVPAPSGAFTMTAHISAFCYQGTPASPRFGIWVGDSGTKMVNFEYGDLGGGPTGRFSINYWNSPTNATSTPWTGTQFTWAPDIWWRISYDGSTLAFSISPTGADSSTWMQLTSLAANTSLATAPAKIGFAVNPQWTNGACNAILGYWKVTQP